MDRERIKGVAQNIKGSIKKAIGKLVGSKKLETEGKVDSATGAIRAAIGVGKDAVRDIAKDRSA